MKQLITIFIALSPLCMYGQLPAEAELDIFIQSEGNYISLTEAGKQNEIISNCIHAIEGYLERNEEKVENYRTDLSLLRVEEGSIFIPLWHMDGFKKLLDLKKTDAKRNDGARTIIVGNVSGKDGSIQIDLTTLKVKAFLAWQ
ncbi:MAG: hypothetical protein AAF696_38525 [Bacteroidota bacterium]